jgi:hypothetical protein
VVGGRCICKIMAAIIITIISELRPVGCSALAQSSRGCKGAHKSRGPLRSSRAVHKPPPPPASCHRECAQRAHTLAPLLCAAHILCVRQRPRSASLCCRCCSAVPIAEIRASERMRSAPHAMRPPSSSGGGRGWLLCGDHGGEETILSSRRNLWRSIRARSPKLIEFEKEPTRTGRAYTTRPTHPVRGTLLPALMRALITSMT